MDRLIEDLDKRIKACARKHRVALPEWVSDSRVHPLQNVYGRPFRGKTENGDKVYGFVGHPWSRLHEVQRETLEWKFELSP